MQIVHNAADSARRWQALDDYYTQNVLHDRHFVCPHYEECSHSHSGRFIEGQLNSLGRCYDLTADGIPFRVMIVGQEVGGGEPRVTMAQRQRRIMDVATAHRFKRTGDFPGRNQHMKGVTNALRLLFGNGLGTDYDGEHVTFADGSRHHLFECFALVNYLLCSAISAHPDARSRRGMSTATMRRNCNEHFRATLETLEPTVIIGEGKSFWPSVRSAFDNLTELSDDLHRAQIGRNQALVCSFSHPSAMHPHNWGSNEQMPYLLDVVQPTIERLRAALFHEGNHHAGRDSR